MKARKILSVIADVLILILFIYLLCFPSLASESTKSALYFCYQTLIPSLFIYMVLAKIIVSLPIMNKIMEKIGLPAVLLGLGTVCGSPIGAQITADLYDSGKISRREGEFLYSFTNNASLSFVVGFVGATLFGDGIFGLKLVVFQLIASCVTALVMKWVIFGKERLPKSAFTKTEKVGFRTAVSESALTMLNLCACVIFFIVAGSSISDALNLDSFGNAVLKSILEFSSGCSEASKIADFAKPLTAFAIGQTGLSVALQVKSVVGNRFGFRYYVLGKSVCCLVVTALTIIFG